MADRTVTVTLQARAAGYVAEMERAGRKTRELGSEAEKLAQKKQAFDTLGRAAFGFGVATTAAVGLAIKAAIDWESAWTGVLKTVDGTAETLDQLEDDLRGLTDVLPASHAEIAAVAEAAGQLGVRAQDVAAFTKVMVDLGETTNLTSDEAATSLAQFMNIMQTAPEDVDRLGAAVVALGNDGASTERDIVQMSQRIAGAGRIIGLTEGETLGLANALASVGIEAEAGGSSVSKIMIDIAKAVNENSEDLQKWAEVAGVSAEDFAEKFSSKPAEALALVVEGMGALNAAGGDVFGTLEELGQSDVRVTRALLSMAGSGDLLRDSLKLGNEAWEDNSALVEEAEKRYATTQAQLEILGNKVNDAAITFGSVFLPAVNDAAAAVGGFADFLGDIPEPLQGILGTIALATGGVAGFGGAALLAVPKIAEMRVAMRTLNLTGKDLAATFAGGGALALGLGAVVGMLSALGREANLSEEQLSKLNAAIAVGDVASFADQLRLGGTAGSDLASALDELEGSGYLAWARDFNAVTSEMVTGIPLIGGLFQGMADEVGRNEAAFNQLGVELGALVAEDFPGAVSEFRRWQQAAGGTDEATRKLLASTPAYADALRALAAEQGETLTEVELLELAMGRGPLAFDLYQAAVKKPIPTLSEIAGAADDARGEVQGLSDELRNFGDFTYDAIEAEIAFRDAIREASEAVGAEGFTATLDKATDAGARNWEVLLELGRTTNDYAAAAYDARGNQDELNGILAEGWQKLYDQAIQFGATEQEAKSYADQLIATPEVISTRVDLDTEAAKSEIQGFITEYHGKQITLYYALERNGRPITVDTTRLSGIDAVSGSDRIGGGGTFAFGGYTGQGSKYEYAGIVHRNEFVSTAETLASSANRSALEYMHAGGDISQWVAAPQYMAAPAAAGASISLDGMRISGSLDLGGGLIGLIDGRLEAQARNQTLDGWAGDR